MDKAPIILAFCSLIRTFDYRRRYSRSKKLKGLFNGATLYGGQAIFFGDNNNVSFSSSDRNMMDNDQCPSPDKMAKAHTEREDHTRPEPLARGRGTATIHRSCH